MFLRGEIVIKQLKLFSDKIVLEHGGSLNSGKRKRARPFYFGRPVHFVLKASLDCVILPNKNLILETLNEMCEKFVVRKFGVGVNADHIHLHLQFSDRGSYNSWVRAVTGVLSRRIRGLEWRFIPYSRVETWGRDFKQVQEYVHFNEREGNLILRAHGFVGEWRDWLTSNLRNQFVIKEFSCDREVS